MRICPHFLFANKAIKYNNIDMKKIAIYLPLFLLPLMVDAQSTVKNLLGKIAVLIVNPIIVLGFVVATVYLFYSIVQLIWGADGGDLDKKRSAVMYGVVGLLIMFSVFGLLNLIINTFNIPCDLFFCGTSTP